jgi:hypothetical protein
MRAARLCLPPNVFSGGVRAGREPAFDALMRKPPVTEQTKTYLGS